MDYATFTADELARAIASADLNQLNDIQEHLMECDLPEREQLMSAVRRRAVDVRASVSGQVQAAQEHDDLIRQALRHLKRD